MFAGRRYRDAISVVRDQDSSVGGAAAAEPRLARGRGRRAGPACVRLPNLWVECPTRRRPKRGGDGEGKGEIKDEGIKTKVETKKKHGPKPNLRKIRGKGTIDGGRMTTPVSVPGLGELGLRGLGPTATTALSFRFVFVDVGLFLLRLP